MRILITSLLVLSNVYGQKFCFECAYSIITDDTGNLLTTSGNENCWKNLGGENQTEIQVGIADALDVCFTQYEFRTTNTTQQHTIRRGIYYNLFTDTVTYPVYSNSTAESIQCTSDFCNKDGSFFENNRALISFESTMPVLEPQNLTCYNCTEINGEVSSNCRSPDGTTGQCEGNFCNTQIISRFNEDRDGTLRFAFNRGCLFDNPEDPGQLPFDSSSTFDSSEFVRIKRENWVCNEPFCNVDMEDERECHECSDTLSAGDDISTSVCLSIPTSGTTIKINSNKVCMIRIINSEGAVQGTMIQRGVADRTNQAYPVYVSNWDENKICAGNMCNTGNGDFGPDHGIVPIKPPNDNQHCLSCYDEDELGDNRPGNWGCWQNPYTGRVEECSSDASSCFTTVKVDLVEENGKGANYKYSVLRGCQGSMSATKQIGKEYHCTDNLCNDLVEESINISPPNPSGESPQVDPNRKFKTCFECSYSELRDNDGNVLSTTGQQNCLDNLSAGNDDIKLIEANQNDVCFTQIRDEITNGTEFVSITRGIYRNQYESQASYPVYTNATDEAFTCTTDLCNTDKSTFRNRETLSSKNILLTSNDEAGEFTGSCYLCNDSPTNPNPACRDPTPELAASGEIETCSGSIGADPNKQYIVGCLTQINGQFDSEVSDTLAYRINRRCIYSEANVGPGRSFTNSPKAGLDVTIDAEETSICNEPYCNIYKEPSRKCYECEYFTDDQIESSLCTQEPTSSMNEVEFNSNMVCTVTLTGNAAPQGTLFTRGLKPRANLKYPTWQKTWAENKYCQDTGCNIGNGEIGPWFGEPIEVDPPSSSKSCLSCYNAQTLTNSQPENDDCWRNPYEGEFEECLDDCFTTVTVGFDDQTGLEPVFNWAIQRGCKENVMRPENSNYGLEYHCLDELCNTWTYEDFDTTVPLPPGSIPNPTATSTTITTTSITTTTDDHDHDHDHDHDQAAALVFNLMLAYFLLMIN